MVLEAIKKVGKKDREAILKAVLATKDFTAGAVAARAGGLRRATATPPSAR